MYDIIVAESMGYRLIIKPDGVLYWQEVTGAKWAEFKAKDVDGFYGASMWLPSNFKFVKPRNV